jgi:hypothetical protein
VQKSQLTKFIAAAGAAAVGMVLAISTVGAHTAPATSHSVTAGALNAAAAMSFPMVVNDPAANTLRDEQDQDAIEDAAKAAALAALAAQEASEVKAAPTACQVADKAEDKAERAADMAEDASEKAGTITESPAEDAAERAAAMAADKAEDATEVPCPRPPDPDSDVPSKATFAAWASGFGSGWNKKG